MSMTSKLSKRAPVAPRFIVLGFLCLTTAYACGGSVKAGGGAKAGSDGEADVNFDAEGDAAWDMTADSQNEEETAQNATLSQPPPPSAQGAREERALLGARHDLNVRSTTPACRCLAVLLGRGDSTGITWTGRRPVIDPNSQLVIALSSDGVPCTEAGPGASYWGYEAKDGNVIVKVEAAVAGRPVTHGAIIPRPAEGKQVFVEPMGNIPYGRGVGGQPRCALGRGS